MKKQIISYFLIILISFLIGYFSGSTYNYFSTTYECEFTTSENINDILSEENITNIISSNNKYKNLSSDNLINGGIYLIQNEDNYTLITYSKYYDSFFSKTSQNVSSRAIQFIKDLLKDKNVTYLNEEIVQKKNYINSYLTGIIVCLVFTLIYLLLDIFVIKKHSDNFEYDNENIYNSFFHKSYWSKAKSFLSSPKKIATLAMLLALLLLSKLIKIPTGFSNLGLTFGFIFFAIIGLIYGPIAGLLIGIISDILGYFLFDSSNTAFFIGYVFQAMISGFIYGLFLYKTKISFFKILLLRLTISLVCNVLIGSFCWGYISNYTFEQTISYMTLFVIPKNLIYLIPQSVVLYIIIKSLSPILYKNNLLDKKIAENISLL